MKITKKKNLMGIPGFMEQIHRLCCFLFLQEQKITHASKVPNNRQSAELDCNDDVWRPFWL